MTITYWTNFSKRINSTKQPTGGTNITVVLKTPCSVDKPVFILNGISDSINYIKWGSRYYYVTEVTWLTNDNIQVSCDLDRMATYKENIKSTSAYVSYATSSYNQWIPDTRLTMSSDIVVTRQAAISGVSATAPSMVLLTAGKDMAAGDSDKSLVGFATAYGISATNAKNLSDMFYDTDLLAEIGKVFTNPYESVISAHYVPWAVSTSGANVYFGKKNSGIVGGGLMEESLLSISEAQSIDIPWKYNDWRDFNPYSTMILYLPFYGSVPIDQSKLKGQTTITLVTKSDSLTGIVDYQLTAGTWQASYSCNTAVQIPLSQITTKQVQGIASAATGIGAVVGGAVSLATGGAAAPAVGAIASGVTAVGAGAMTAFQQDTDNRGGVGSFAHINQVLKSANTSYLRFPSLTLYSHQFGVSSPANVNTVLGRPLFETKTLSALSGYIKCEGASVDITGHEEDKNIVSGMLNAGFYLE